MEPPLPLISWWVEFVLGVYPSGKYLSPENTPLKTPNPVENTPAENNSPPAGREIRILMPKRPVPALIEP